MTPPIGLPFDAAVEDDGTLHLAWTAPEKGLYYTRRTGSEHAWSTPVEIAGADRTEFALPALFAGGGTLRLALRCREGLLVWSSRDGGRTWKTEQLLPLLTWRDPELGIMREHLLSRPLLLANEQSAYLLYSRYGPGPRSGMLRWKDRSGGALPSDGGEEESRDEEERPWEEMSLPHEVADRLPSPWMAAAHARGLFLSWQETGYTRRPRFWPFGMIIDRDWRNSDISARLLQPEEGSSFQAGAKRILTPDLSLVRVGGGADSNSGGPLVVWPSSREEVYVFWSGKRRVGQTEDAFGCPDAIFYTVLDPNAL